MRYPQVIQDPRHYRVDYLLDGLGAGVKGGVGRQNGGSREHEQLEILDRLSEQRIGSLAQMPGGPGVA